VDGLAHPLGPGEPDLELAGVDVGVDRRGVEVDEDGGERVAVAELVAVGVDDRSPDRRGRDVPAVDERGEVRPARTVRLGVADEAMDPVDRPLSGAVVDVDHRAGDLAPVGREHCPPEIPLPGRREALAPVVFERDRHVRVRQRVPRDHAGDVVELRRGLFQVPPARGHVVEQVRDLDRRPLRTARGLGRDHVSALDE